MKRMALFILLFSSLFVLMWACSASNLTESKSDNSPRSMGEVAVAPQVEAYMDYAVADQDVKAPMEERSKEIRSNRMIIHQAQIQMNVKNLEKAQLTIEKKVADYDGYIVESNVYRENDETVSGRMMVRIPEKHFQQFLKDAEGEAVDVLQRNVNGQDVTEEYVDLEPRVKSKRVVEERLLDFMGKADKTEDLLKISNDLAKVQEEIEIIVGQMKYLENQTSYSTVEIYMYESSVVVPGIDSKNLDTWEKTKKQFATSTNFLLAAVSGLIVFLIGNLPVIIIVLLIGVGAYFLVKRKRKME